jgi:hypothetical protein
MPRQPLALAFWANTKTSNGRTAPAAPNCVKEPTWHTKQAN